MAASILIALATPAALASNDPPGAGRGGPAWQILGELLTPPSSALPAGPPTTLTLNADDGCYGDGEDTVTVTIDLSDAPSLIVGGQFLLEYDPAVLDFLSADPGMPFTVELYEDVDDIAGTIDYAVGVPLGSPGTMADSTMAVLTFEIVPGAEFCAGASGLVALRAGAPPTQITDIGGTPIMPMLVDLAAITIDQEAPAITCPADAMAACVDEVQPGPGSAGSATATDNCTAAPAITFSDSDNSGAGCPGDPLVITRTWSASDDCGNVSSCMQVITVVDTTAPAFLMTPADITTNADAGGCSATLTAAEIGAPTADDNCDPLVAITFVRSDGAPVIDDPFDSADSPITITWSATDDCGNVAQDVQTITVNPVNDLAVAVELASADPGPFDRCITFVLHECGGGTETVEAVLTFSGGVAMETIEVPCGAYDCIAARDRLHTLRRTDDDGDFGVLGNEYVSDFTASGTTNDALIGGNLNDDAYVDILDFGLFSGQFDTNYGTPDTSCATASPHGDISGNGVANVADFTFIQVNFFVAREANCCGLAGAVAGSPETWLGEQQPFAGRNALPAGPIARIAVSDLRRLGMPQAAAGDLNSDGWLDVTDIAAFMGGARP